ncbi:MAG: hypothetical protein IJL14_10080 [Selenomonadaceae bacterium]|nr:hypothetical protein [Selenomonadaceae bacterium]
MTKQCPICKKDFETRYISQKYCGHDCYRTAMKKRQGKLYYDAQSFQTAWEAWKKDFALSKTQSNL